MKSRLQLINQALWADHHRTKNLLTFSIGKEEWNVKAGNKVEQLTDNKNTKGSKTGKYYGPFSTKQFIGLLLGPILFILTLLIPIAGLSFAGKAVLATTIWVVTWWITEPFAVGAVSLLPMVLLPLMNAVDGTAAAKAYGDPLIFLFLGGFAIALALERWRLHERIALTVIGLVGGSLSGLVAGITLASAFISMWVSNTATAMMALPIGTAITFKIVELMKSEGVHSPEDEHNFTTSVILGVAYGAIIGGSTTLIGTPPNLILAGLASKLAGFEITFAKWMLFAFPLCAVSMVFAIFYLTKIGYPLKVKKLAKGKEFILSEKKKLGKVSYEEKIVLTVFSITVFFWLTRTFIWTDIIPGLSDSIIAVTAAIILYMFPASKKNGGFILEASSFAKMPWGVLLLVGGGLSIAVGFSSTDLAAWIGDQLLALQDSSYLLILAATTILSIGITQVMPNTACTTILVPIAASLGAAIGVNPVALMTAAALGSGFAYTLPMGTPTTGIIYASGKIKMSDMLKSGLWMVLISTILIIGFTYLIFPLIFGV